MLIRLHRWAGRLIPLLFPCDKVGFSPDKAYMMYEHDNLYGFEYRCNSDLLSLSLPNEVGRLIVFALFLIILFFFFHFFFFPPKFCSDKFSVTTGRIVLKFGDMVNMDVKLCKRLSKFKMSGSKDGPPACPDYFSLTTEGIVLNFLI